jgi:predicted membrane-bound spermidine synthase
MTDTDSRTMNQLTRRVLFFLFFLSGFCSLAYQVVWTRMAFASFGIITPVLSVVLSVFMLGLAVGAWAGGRFIASLVEKTGLSAVVFYAGAEFLIGLGAFAVPKLFAVGEYFLLAAGQTNSIGYLFLSALVLAFSILPWCLFMGATFPLMMAYVRERDSESTESFSFLYLANVLGAMSGTFLTAVVLVEKLGFRHTLWVAAAGNFTITVIGGYLGWKQRGFEVVALPEAEPYTGPGDLSSPGNSRSRLIKWILFSTGFCAMAMEVVWTRAFTPILKTQVYSFAWIVFSYLGATFIGSLTYRRNLRAGSVHSMAKLMFLLAVAAFFPIFANDYQLMKWVSLTGLQISVHVHAALLLISISPVCIILGYLTPRLIDEYAAGQPRDAGNAYAINVMGCILGPLVASYVLLPNMGERYALILLSSPFLILCLPFTAALTRWQHVGATATAGIVLVWSLFFAVDFESLCVRMGENTVVRRDYAASVISYGDSNLKKRLLVNGIGMTILTPVTKCMVHLPLAFHKGRPESALLICFGMGTTYRSALSWNIETTAVELVPGVKEVFGFYHADAPQVLKNPKGQIIIDDGRRYLKRTKQKFDVIVIDPPPPIEAAGSSLLYSKEFYELAKQHLKPGGILQAWLPGGAPLLTGQAILRSVDESFPHTRCFDSLDSWGTHILASMDPIENLSPAELAGRLPAGAEKDLLEWAPKENATHYLALISTRETPIKNVLNPNRLIQVTDDNPYNEYFLLRECGF